MTEREQEERARRLFATTLTKDERERYAQAIERYRREG